MVKLMKTIKMQIQSHFLAVCFLMFGYICSILLISIGTTSITNKIHSSLEQTEGYNKNTIKVSINFESNIYFDDFIKSLRTIDKSSKIRFNNLPIYIGNEDSKTKYDLITEFFLSRPNWTYPIISGRYYNYEDVDKGSKVAVVGNKLKKNIYIKDNKQKINISGEEYEVIGIAGKIDKESIWDESVFMPFTSIPEKFKKSFANASHLEFVVNNSDIYPLDQCRNLEKELKKVDNKIKFQLSEIKDSNSIYSNAFSSSENLIVAFIYVFIIAIINMITLTYYWILDRRMEIAIKKAFGIEDYWISITIYIEMLIISLLSTIIALCIQLGLDIIFENIAGYSLRLSWENILVAVITSVITSCIISVIPIKKSLKIQPIEAIKL